MWAKNFRIMDDGLVCIKDHETGKWFEAFVACARYECCRNLIWIEKDYFQVFKMTMEVDLTSDEPQI